MDMVPLPSPDEPRYSIAEVCKRFGFGKTRFYKMVREGHFPRPQTICGKRYYTLADLAAFVQLADRWFPGAFEEEKNGRGKSEES